MGWRTGRRRRGWRTRRRRPGWFMDAPPSPASFLCREGGTREASTDVGIDFQEGLLKPGMTLRHTLQCGSRVSFKGEDEQNVTKELHVIESFHFLGATLLVLIPRPTSENFLYLLLRWCSISASAHSVVVSSSRCFCPGQDRNPQPTQCPLLHMVPGTWGLLVLRRPSLGQKDMRVLRVSHADFVGSTEMSHHHLS